MAKKPYRIANLPYIGEADACGKLVYKLEHQIGDLVEKLGKAIAAVYAEYDLADLTEDYREQIPEALASILSRYDRTSGLAAVIGYLRKEHGADVDRMIANETSAHLVIKLPAAIGARELDMDTLPPKGRGFR